MTAIKPIIKNFLSDENKLLINLNKNLSLNIPILIAARNEEQAIKNTLTHIVNSLIDYKNSLKKLSIKIKDNTIFKQLENMQFYIFICDNNSIDKTVNNIHEFKIQNKKIIDEYKINILIIKEIKSGKLNALKSLLKYLEINFLNCFDHIIFTDAEIEWNTNVYSELINFKIKNSSIKLIGTKIIPKNKKIGVWGKMELLPYYGYGDFSTKGHGIFMKFVSGMCYLADKSIIHLLKNEIPPMIGNEDVAISVIIGKNNIHILKETWIYYHVADNLIQFIKIRGRHIRELYKLERWLKYWYINKIIKKHSRMINKKRYIKKCVKLRFNDISESRIFKYILNLFFSSEKLIFSINGLKKLFNNISTIKLGWYFTFIFLPICILCYAIIKLISFIQSFYVKKEGWQTIR